MKKLIEQITKFRDDRNWKQFHTPENLAKSINIEASEMLELFQWNNDFELEKLNEELADIFIYCLLLADTVGVDIEEIVLKKIKINNEKYPVKKSYGNSKKYNKL